MTPEVPHSPAVPRLATDPTFARQSASSPEGAFDGFDSIRQAASAIAKDAELVRVNYDAVQAYAGQLATIDAMHLPGEALDAQRWYLDDPLGAAAFALCVNCLNFGSGYFPLLKKDSSNSGFNTVAAGLARYFEQHWPFAPAHLGEIGPAEVLGILGQSDERADSLQPLTCEMSTALAELATLVEARGRTFAAFFAEVATSPTTLVAALAPLAHYRDGYLVGKTSFMPLKKAQITVADLARVGMATHSFPGLIAQKDELTAFADNSVPQVLEADGILTYDPRLRRHIDSGLVLEYGSQAEFEIRAATIEAVESIQRHARAWGATHLDSATIDGILWQRKHLPETQAHYRKRPSHKTTSVFY